MGLVIPTMLTCWHFGVYVVSCVLSLSILVGNWGFQLGIPVPQRLNFAGGEGSSVHFFDLVLGVVLPHLPCSLDAFKREQEGGWEGPQDHSRPVF